MRVLRIARISTVKFFVFTQLRSQLEAIRATGADLTVVSSGDDNLSENTFDLEGINFVPLNIPRNINLLNDFRALIALIRFFNNKNFDIVHSTTPKAGLLCAIAGKIAGVKVRLHTFTGQPWVGINGLKRHVLRLCDKIIGCLNTRCYADSYSQKQFLVRNGIVDSSRIYVLGEGSLAGVDLHRFNPMRYSSPLRSQFKQELDIPPCGRLLLFVGRITCDKGIKELIQAFNEVIAHPVDAYLVFVGPFEVDGRQCIDSIKDDNIRQRIRLVGFSSEPEKYMSIADVLCLPSYREGFGTVVIEAAAMGVPTVGSDIYGLSDAVVNGETGILVPAKNHQALGRALIKILNDDGFRSEMANKARRRVLDKFCSTHVSELVVKEYESLVGQVNQTHF